MESKDETTTTPAGDGTNKTTETDDGAKYNDSKIDNDDDLEDTTFNRVWIKNKKIIKGLYSVKGINQELVNYAKNLILYYKQKIEVVKSLIKRKSTDSKKNFIGDTTIQQEQIDNIGDIILADRTLQNMSRDKKDIIIKGYYSNIGNESGSVMKKDYDDRNRTIRYLLLIKEYEANIEDINNAITTSDQIVSEEVVSVLSDADEKLLKSLGETNFFGGAPPKNVTEFATTPILSDGMSQLAKAFKEYSVLVNSPITDPELQLVLNQFSFYVECLSKDPTSYNTSNFDSVCSDLLNRINVLLENTKITHFMENASKDEVIEMFVNSNNLLELDWLFNNMFKKLGINIDDKGRENMSALDMACRSYNLDKIWYLLSKGANINQKLKTAGGKTILEGAASDYAGMQRAAGNTSPKFDIDLTEKHGLKEAGITSALLTLGADQTNTRNFINPVGFPITKETIAQSKAHLDTYAKQMLSKLQEEQNLASEDKKEEGPLDGFQKQIDSANETREKQFAEWATQTEAIVKRGQEINDEVIKLKEQGTKLLEEQKAIQDKLGPQIEAIKAETKKCEDKFKRMADELEALVKSIKKRIKDVIASVKTEETIISTLAAEVKEIEGNEVLNAGVMDETAASFDSAVNNIASSDKELGASVEKEDPHEMFVRKYIDTNYVKKNLYEFINECRRLDSVPEWRAEITTLMVGYLTKYISNPNDPTKHVNVIPSYGYFNLVLMGTPGVGKSYSAGIIGKALKWCGFLTIGDMKEIKKPDIIGSYTGQTAPKVYNELTQGLGNVIFIDEAYSIAGPRDEVKKTFNEFGQEALDAITDYTSEHIGLLAFIVAGYEYEMQQQFLNVNIGLPRRFPTVLVLRRYDMKSFWKILETPIIKFCPKYQVHHHHHACFELLNLMFNFQWTPNPVLQISKKWRNWWQGYKLNNMIANLKINMSTKADNIISIPFFKLSEFNKKIENIETTNITSEMIDVMPLTELLSRRVNMVTATFVKSMLLFKFCRLRNGDLFRSQADNLTKFGQIMLEDKILNPSGLFNIKFDSKEGNREWIEYVYFNLYFIKNPNKPVKNVEFSFQTPSEAASETPSEAAPETPEEDKKGGAKSKRYTQNAKNKKNGYQNNRTRRMRKQHGGDQASFNKLLGITTQIEDYFNALKKDDYKAIVDQDERRPDPVNMLRLFLSGRPATLSPEVKFYIDHLTLTELDTIEHKITTIMEECNDVIQVASKANEYTIMNKFGNVSKRMQELYNYIQIRRPNAQAEARAKAKTEETAIATEPKPNDIQQNADPEVNGNELYKHISETNIAPSLAEKLTGMFLTLDKNTIDQLYKSDDLMYNWIEEGLKVLENNDKTAQEFKDDIIKAREVIANKRSKANDSVSGLESNTNDLKVGDAPVNQSADEATNADAEAKIKADADAEAKLKADAEAEAKIKADADAEAEAKLKADAEEKTKEATETETMGNADTEAKNVLSVLSERKSAMDTSLKTTDKIRGELKTTTPEEILANEKTRRGFIKDENGNLVQIGTITKDLVFNIKNIDFADLADANDITAQIIYYKKADNDNNGKPEENEKLKTIFDNFMKKYSEYLDVYEAGDDLTPEQTTNLPIFIYTYLLLDCYATAFVQSKKPLGKFDVDSWWFFTADDFKTIATDLDFEKIIKRFDELTASPAANQAVTPAPAADTAAAIVTPSETPPASPRETPAAAESKTNGVQEEALSENNE